MKWETKRNFMVGGGFLLVMVGLVAYQGIRTKNCDDSHHTVLVLVDYTDPIGGDARAAMKDRVWNIIESAPNFSAVILRPILGVGVSGEMLDKEMVQLCRPEKPDFTSPWKGAVKIKDEWRRFKSQACGAPEPDEAAGDLRCGDERRQGSFFEKERPQSESSPILEQIVDNTRRFFTVPGRPVSWDLVIATDWKEYTPQLDLHTKACVGSANALLSKIPLFIPPTERGKVFRAPSAGDAASGRSSTITGLFVLREGMSDGEADCLEQSFAKHFLVTNASNFSAESIVFERLPRTAVVP